MFSWTSIIVRFHKLLDYRSTALAGYGKKLSVKITITIVRRKIIRRLLLFWVTVTPPANHQRTSQQPEIELFPRWIAAGYSPNVKRVKNYNYLNWAEVCDVSCDEFFLSSYDLQNDKKICRIVIFDKKCIFYWTTKF